MTIIEALFVVNVIVIAWGCMILIGVLLVPGVLWLAEKCGIIGG